MVVDFFGDVKDVGVVEHSNVWCSCGCRVAYYILVWARLHMAGGNTEMVLGTGCVVKGIGVRDL